ncbi:MAG TPA: hypothetical protein DEG43_10875 [Acidimicrobiaceae bacterium]|jgi:bifunctional DNase/RNase|nr:hypothetical protein [Acidimicrobiaceae bacterium]
MLGEVGDRSRTLTIAIARPEAVAIELALVGEQPSRPLTHDLMQTIFEAADLHVEQIVITDLQETTFYAELQLEVGETHQRVSCRPSDAVALALRADAPMFVSEAVMDLAGVEAASEDDLPLDPDEMVEQFRDFIDSVDPEDFG